LGLHGEGLCCLSLPVVAYGSTVLPGIMVHYRSWQPVVVRAGRLWRASCGTT